MLVKQCLEQGLRSPDFECNNDFNVVFWRNENVEGGQTGLLERIRTEQDTNQDTNQLTEIQQIIYKRNRKRSKGYDF